MKYRITYLAGKFDTSNCPPTILNVIFPSFNGWSVSLSENELIVEVPEGITPVEISPLIKIELL